MELGAPGLFAMLMMFAKDSQEQLMALKALDAHVCEQSCQVKPTHAHVGVTITLYSKTHSDLSSSYPSKNL